ncbi:insertion sequence 2 OrfA protein [Shigella sonnei]|nr:insertion sequence 2 OrfA protein [Shigella sonnei]
MIDVLGPEKRRRRTTQEKIAIVQQSFEPGMTVSLVARQHGVAVDWPPESPDNQYHLNK